MQQIKTGIVAFGKAARIFHAPVLNYLPQFNLAKVVERHNNESQKFYPEVEVIRSTDALLEDPDLDLVVITTPNDSHFSLARQCLEAGKHVVVDKPFTTSSDDARKLIELAKDKGKLVNAFQSRRWDGDFKTLNKLAKQDLLGGLVELESRYDRFRNYQKPNAWREKAGEGTGVFFDLGPHLIDQALVLFGFPESISADIRIQRDGGMADDHFEVILDYGTVKVSLRGGMLVRSRTHRFLLHGTNGSFIKYGMDPQEEALIAGGSPADPGWGVESEEQWGLLDTSYKGLHIKGRIETETGGYQEYYENIAEVLQEEALPAVTEDQMIATIRIIELAHQSSREKRVLPFSLS